MSHLFLTNKVFQLEFAVRQMKLSAMDRSTMALAFIVKIDAFVRQMKLSAMI